MHIELKRLGFRALQPPLRPAPRIAIKKPCSKNRTNLPPRCYSDEEERCDIADQECFSVSLRLQDARLQLQTAIEAEDFGTAAGLRDHVHTLELAHRSITVAQNKQSNVLFIAGTCMRHRVYGYRGVIVGYDPECLAPNSWRQSMRVHLLENGARQPFYHILVDIKDRPGGQTTYVAQENVVPSRVTYKIEHPLVERYLQILDGKDGKSWVYLPRAELRELYKDDF